MFETATAIGLLIVFLLPGYVWRSVEGQFVYLDHRLPWEKFALGLLARSTFLYVPFASWFYRIWRHTHGHPHHYHYHASLSVDAVFFVGIYPAVVGIISGVFRQKDGPWIVANWIFSKARIRVLRDHRIPTAWEAVFNRRMTSSWVIVTKKNGTQIRGLLGPESHLSVDPEVPDIYISHVLYGDSKGNYQFVPNTKGIYIRAEEISTVELTEYVSPKDSSDEQKQQSSDAD